ncbi:MAG: SAM-dependent DNA methyltransferase, partial [bacterium]
MPSSYRGFTVMFSARFSRVLAATGYLTPNQAPVTGLLTRAQDLDLVERSLKLAFETDSGRLGADAIYMPNAGFAVFKDAPNTDEASIRGWHEQAWNLGIAPLLWVVLPERVLVFNCYEAPRQSHQPLGAFSDGDLKELNRTCGRTSADTGQFWTTPISETIDRQGRVDRELLDDLERLQRSLVKVTRAQIRSSDLAHGDSNWSRELAQKLIGRCLFAQYLFDRNLVPTD